MADGLNDARAMRIAEVLNDYRTIAAALAAYQPYLAQTQNGTAGYTMLNQAIVQNTQLLSIPFVGGDIQVPTSPGEGTKAQLQRILLDASSRRFRAYRLYQRGAAAVRWIQRRNQLLQGRAPTGRDQQALASIDNVLRTEIIAVTDNKVFNELNQRDVAAGNWTGEMPTLARIQQFVQQQG